MPKKLKVSLIMMIEKEYIDFFIADAAKLKAAMDSSTDTQWIQLNKFCYDENIVLANFDLIIPAMAWLEANNAELVNEFTSCFG